MSFQSLVGYHELIYLYYFKALLHSQLHILAQLGSLDCDVHQGGLFWSFAYPNHLLLDIVLPVQLSQLVYRDLGFWISPPE